MDSFLEVCKKMTNLWEKDNYTSSIPYIANQYITEYDIVKANISVLYHEGIIDKSMHDILWRLDKRDREVFVGNMQKHDSHVSEVKAEGIRKFRRIFCEANGIEDYNILSIKNDAIFIIGKECANTSFDNITFRVANQYKLYAKIGILEIYYGLDPITCDEVIDVKGIKDCMLEYHREFMIFYLCEVFHSLLVGRPEDAIKYHSEVLKQFLNRSLPMGFYREFNAGSGYKVCSNLSSFSLMYLDEKYKYIVDISTNLSVFREIGSILSDIFMQSKRKRIAGA